MATGIPYRTWLDEDPEVIDTALEVLEQQAKDT